MIKIKKTYIIYLLGLCGILALLVFLFLYDHLDKDAFKYGPIANMSEYIEKKYYNIQINYPRFKNSTLNKQINSIINNEKKVFLKSIKKNKKVMNELNINYSYSTVNDLYSIHIRSYSYVGKDNKYRRTDKIFYYDAKLNEEISIDKIINNDKVYEFLRNQAYDYLNKNKELYNIKDVKNLNERLVATKDNYHILSFGEDNIEISFEPNSVSNYDNEINISVNYDKIIKYLNSNYININTDNDSSEDNYVSKNYDRIRNSKNFENKKLVAITFDDGPGYAKTERLLTELDKRDARVSFFMLGELANKQKDLVKKVYEYGHTIGSHTYDHKNLKKLKEEQLLFEVNYTNEILSTIIGEDIRFIRPPYGAYNEKVLQKVNMAFILWNKDTLDWKYRNAEKVRDYIVENAEDGDIILLHDIHTTSIDGVIMAIDILKDKGFGFVSLDEMLVYRNKNLEINTAYRFFK